MTAVDICALVFMAVNGFTLKRANMATPLKLWVALSIFAAFVQGFCVGLKHPALLTAQRAEVDLAPVAP